MHFQWIVVFVGELRVIGVRYLRMGVLTLWFWWLWNVDGDFRGKSFSIGLLVVFGVQTLRIRASGLANRYTGGVNGNLWYSRIWAPRLRFRPQNVDIYFQFVSVVVWCLIIRAVRSYLSRWTCAQDDHDPHPTSIHMCRILIIHVWFHPDLAICKTMKMIFVSFTLFSQFVWSVWWAEGPAFLSPPLICRQWLTCPLSTKRRLCRKLGMIRLEVDWFQSSCVGV